jgi:predicted ABC-type ATPase
VPRVAIIAGPNGSGKTTFYYAKLAALFPTFVNADQKAALLVSESDRETRDRSAAVLAEAARLNLLTQREDFAFETVFSRTAHWLDFLRKLKDAGYEVWLFFICTESPLLNVARVEARELAGGHSVPPAKVFSRFPGSIETALESRTLVDELWLYDNTSPDTGHRLVARFIRGQVDYFGASQPEWAAPFFLRQAARNMPDPG